MPPLTVFRTCAYRLWPLPVLALCLGLACRFFPGGPTPTPTRCADAPDPTRADIDYALAFSGATFPAPDWEKSYTVGSQRVSITWLNNSAGAVAFLEYLVYSCGYTEADIDAYYNDHNFEAVIFKDYQNLEPQAQCANADETLRLYTFTGTVQETAYAMRYWVKLDTQTRLLDLLLAFPQSAEAQLDRYARQAFPELSVCTP